MRPGFPLPAICLSAVADGLAFGLLVPGRILVGMLDASTLGLVGIVGAITFPLVVALLTVRYWAFLRDRGWRPIRASDVAFPSVLALTPSGYVQVANFIVLGLALLATAAGLWQVLEPRPTVGVLLLAGAGVASLALAVPTDGSVSKVETLSGAIHAVAFVGLLICTLLGVLLIGLGLGDVPGWQGLAGPSIAVAVGLVVLTVASFVLPSVGGLASLLLGLLMLAWVVIVGLRVASAG